MRERMALRRKPRDGPPASLARCAVNNTGPPRGPGPSIPAVFDLFPIRRQLEFGAVVRVMAADAGYLFEFEIFQLAVLACVILHVVVAPAVAGFAGDVL